MDEIIRRTQEVVEIALLAVKEIRRKPVVIELVSSKSEGHWKVTGGHRGRVNVE